MVIGTLLLGGVRLRYVNAWWGRCTARLRPGPSICLSARAKGCVEGSSGVLGEVSDGKRMKFVGGVGNGLVDGAKPPA